MLGHHCSQPRSQTHTVRHDVVIGAAGDVLLQRVPLDGMQLLSGEGIEYLLAPHLRDRVAGTVYKRSAYSRLWFHEISEKIFAPEGAASDCSDHTRYLCEYDAAAAIDGSANRRHRAISRRDLPAARAKRYKCPRSNRSRYHDSFKARFRS